MAIYIRKVVKAKWDWRNPVGSNIAANALGTDGVTNCCKTSNNTLSIWKIDSELLASDDDKKIIATLATNGGSLSPIDYIILSDEELEFCGLSIDQEDGDSLISDVKSKHYNIINLDMGSVSALGLMIKKKVSGVKAGEKVTQPTQLKKIDVGSIKSYINQFIPKDTAAAETLKLKNGFKRIYD
ncbi:hypothetical protein PDTA9759_11510 [Phytobacter diazotrophicus]|uniref:Uncharacterized protein n=2 Tax=Enterobacteriaceae TaxID=543 RepID=A0ABM7VRK6_9ENTR|nr:hypothetical protein MRY16398_11810 [Phytobacter sp. MRY16-398]BDD49663.1 hypothetical protein PDTA9734_11500 [Phytobacter diazotrophicus]BEG80694.1 hypothetical protein PDTA9730_11500 [Phytobacter diazotrophicus]BEG86495.1 hypothetical protein PDTA9759_11510 [Phytobacter diazotrophicus]BEG92291.1 hypothetical protein PDTA9832_11500 [Phytobacter diazotrophicus]